MYHHDGAAWKKRALLLHRRLLQCISPEGCRPWVSLIFSVQRIAASLLVRELGQDFAFAKAGKFVKRDLKWVHGRAVDHPTALGTTAGGWQPSSATRVALLAGSVTISFTQPILLPLSGALAREWYVEAEVSSLASLQQPSWRSFAQIDWARVSPGDTIHIVGDGCGLAYLESLIVGRSGTSLAPLIISGTSRSGRGSPVIDGENQREAGVVLQGRNHVIVRGLTIRNHADAGISIQGSRAGVIIEDNSLFSGDPGGGNARGIDARQNRGENPLIVRRNQFSTPGSSRAQTDGIYSMDNDGVLFEGNHIVVSNSDTTGHSDAFQSFRDKNINVHGNWFEQANAAVADNHGVWISNGREGGAIDFSQNIVLTPNLVRDSAVTYYRSDDWLETPSVRFQHNTIIGGGRALNLANAPQAEVHHNLIAPAAEGIPVMLLGQAPPAGSIDGNVVWTSSGIVGQDVSQSFTWIEWQKRGYDAHGANVASRPAPRGIHDVQAAAAILPGNHGARRFSVPPALADPLPEPCPTAR